ncbi:MAG: hypothetical protein ACI81R_001911 [Bradymonadia bacterium]|jgi:hypothetical protein
MRGARTLKREPQVARLAKSVANTEKEVAQARRRIRELEQELAIARAASRRGRIKAARAMRDAEQANEARQVAVAKLDAIVEVLADGHRVAGV